MTRESALDRARKLLALAAPSSGATEEERRTAAVQAARLMSEHGLHPTAQEASPRSPIDLDRVTQLALRVLELEHDLSEAHDRHRWELREANARWSQVVAGMRLAEERRVRQETKTIATKTVLKEREAFARHGGRARDRKLDPERKTEIGRKGAQARWAKWRERRGV